MKLPRPSMKMKRNKDSRLRMIAVLNTMVILLILTVVILAFVVVQEKRRVDMLQMYDFNVSMFDTVDGVYYPADDYYCVWTAHTGLNKINEVDLHEFCHALVKHHKAYFCYDDFQIPYGEEIYLYSQCNDLVAADREHFCE